MSTKAELMQEIRRDVAKVKRDVQRVAEFFAAFDAWAQSPDGAGGDRFDAVMWARGEIHDLFPCPEAAHE